MRMTFKMVINNCENRFENEALFRKIVCLDTNAI